MKQLLLALYIITLSGCASPQYAENVFLPEAPDHARYHVNKAVLDYEMAFETDLPDNVLDGWTLVYVGRGQSHSNMRTGQIVIGRENEPELILKHEVIHVLLWHEGVPSPLHHSAMCQEDLCYGSRTCNQICKDPS